ncbi:MAG: SMP-30/gluconolactonase/LRE family protein [Verrucomicrobiae bacterium]|nr:SMP-30/gluconolactonase/LRE family protein [Verrucomicrobiae bacterium]
MKAITLMLSALGGLAAVSLLSAAEITAPGAQLELLTDTCKFTEGPAADVAGNVYFTDQPNDRILVWTVEDRLETFMQPCGRSNGMFFDRDGNLLTCADERNELWLIPLSKQPRVLVKEFDGKFLNAPNDLWVRPDNGLYFTDPLYPRTWWKHRDAESQQAGQHVYYLTPDREQLKPVATDLEQPNGIIGTPDGKTLYVADIRAGKTYAYDIQPDGSLVGKRLFCEMGSDGMTLDQEGNVYLTGRGVTVFDQTGAKIQQIDGPKGWTANVCFGGKDHDTLYITANTRLYRIKTRVKGAY